MTDHAAIISRLSYHGAGVRMGERELRIGGYLQLSTDLIEFAWAAKHHGKPPTEGGRSRLCGVGCLKLRKIALDTVLSMSLSSN